MLFSKDEDFLAFERVVEESLRTRRMRLCAYCLMPNHWHFVVWPERDGDLPAFMQQVTNTHVKRWKEHRHEIGYGHLYQGRYKCFPVETEDYFYQVVRYVERNALWANLVGKQTCGVGRACDVRSGTTPRVRFSRHGLCHVPPIGYKWSTNRRRKPNWRRCVVASIAVGPSAIGSGLRMWPSDWGWNGRFDHAEGQEIGAETPCSLDLVAVTFLFSFCSQPPIDLYSFLTNGRSCRDVHPIWSGSTDRLQLPRTLWLACGSYEK